MIVTLRDFHHNNSFDKFNFETEYIFDEVSQFEQIKDIIKSVYEECRL